ncbi:MAG TPA: MASE1 domain-containing protein, partial [Candidatus Polarisedimenticolia bacterium]|nr:MASE1 domain-containing protein [Candidatus Polarisedimenticolia bacterium]
MRRQDSLRYLAENLTLLFLYYSAGRVGLALAIAHPSVSLVWPPSGIALAALTLLGPQSWPTVLLGAFLVNLSTSSSVPLALAIATGNTLEAAVGAWLVTRYAGGRRAFDRPVDVLRFAGGAALLATVASATIGVGSLVVSGRATAAQFGALWQTWWLGDAVGVVVAAPFLILWSDSRWPAWRGRLAEVAGLSVTLLGVGLLVFTDRLSDLPERPTLAYLCVVPLVWAGLRFGQKEVSAAIVVLGGVAIWNTLQSAGPFAGPSPTEALVLLQIFLGIVALIALGVGAHATERRAMEAALAAARADLERTVEERTRTISSTSLELRKSEARFRNFIEAAQDPLLIVDRRGRIVLVNARAEATFGYRRDELFGQPVEMLLPERFREAHLASREEYFRFPRLRSMGEGPDLYALRKDGAEIPVEIMLSPLETEKGTLVSAAIRDITRRRQAEESVARLAAVVASSDEAIISTDAEGFITTWNAAAERVFGYPAGEVIGRSSAFMTAPGRAGEMERLLERLKRREQVRHETQILRKDGTVIDVALTAFPVIGRNGRDFGFSTMFRDITDEKRAEEARREAEILTGQVQEMSRHTHEIALLSELGDVLRAAVRVAEAYPVIPRFLRELFPGESGALYMFDDQHSLYATVLSWGDAAPQEDAFPPTDCWALRRARLHEVDDPDGEMICQHLAKPVNSGSLCIPLMARGRTLGLLHLRGRPDRRGRSTSDGVRGEYRQRLAKTVAQQIGSALYDLTIQETL